MDWIDEQQKAQLFEQGLITEEQLNRMSPSGPAAAPPAGPVVAQPAPVDPIDTGMVTPDPLPPVAAELKPTSLLDEAESEANDDKYRSDLAKLEERKAKLADMKAKLKEQMKTDLGPRDNDMNRFVPKMQGGLDRSQVEKKYAKQFKELMEAEELLGKEELRLHGGQVDPGAKATLVSDTFTEPGQAEAGGGFQMPSFESRGLDMKEAAVLEAAEAGRRAGEAEAAHWQAKDDAQTRMMASQEQERQAEQARVDQEYAKYDAAANEIADLKVDPGRFWANADTSSKVLAAIGLIFGAFGEGGNKAVPVLQRAVQNDMAAQEANIRNKKDALGAKRSALQVMIDRFGDNEVARKATEAAFWRSAEAQGKALQARSKSSTMAAQALSGLADIQLKREEKEMEFQKAMAAQIALERGDTRFMKPEDRERFVPGFGLALTPGAATELRKKVGAVNNAKAGIRDLLEILDKPVKSLNPVERGKAELGAQMLIGALRLEIVGPGALSESEIKILNNIIADPSKVFSLDAVTRGKLETLIQKLDTGLRETAKAEGFVPIGDQLGITPREK